MPGPTEVGLSRSATVRRGLAALLIIVLMAAVASVVAAVQARREPTVPTALSKQRSVEEATLRLVPAPASTGAATCTDPVARQVWRVTWRASGPPGTMTAGPSAATLQSALTERAGAVTLIPTGFAVRPTSRADGWQSRDNDRWLLRWSPTLAETATAAPSEQWARPGSLATLAAIPMSVRQDPRFVTPDGACTVYLAPFVSGTAGQRNSVAVVGDSLLGQLFASEDGTATGAGWLRNRLVTAGDRVELAGQGGRRWTIIPGSGTGQERADQSMLDEIRGLREARSMVIALGTNDAGWVAQAPDQEQYELRLAWVILHLAPILDELRDHGHCTVLATMATRNKSYLGSPPGRFDAAATRINDYLRERANADPKHRLRLWDWAARADWHGTTDAQPWFGTDTIHLKQSGFAAYADELAAAAALC